MDRYDQDQRKAASNLLKNLSEHPADFRRHVQLAKDSLTLSITYGIRVDSPENPYFHAAEEAIETIQAALIPAFPVEFLPFREFPLPQQRLSNISQSPTHWVVRYFPSRLPGGGARGYEEHIYGSSLNSITLPIQYVTERLKVCPVCADGNPKSKLDRRGAGLVPS